MRNSAQTLVKVVIEDANDEAPVLTHPAGGVVYVRPGMAAGSLLTTLAARDPDLGDDRVTFERVSGPVSLDRWSGMNFNSKHAALLSLSNNITS